MRPENHYVVISHAMRSTTRTVSVRVLSVYASREPESSGYSQVARSIGDS